MTREKENAYQTYNIIGDWFHEHREKTLIEKPYLDRIIDLAGEGASMLDLGCGTGLPIMGYLLSRNMVVTGVDASHRMLELAQVNLPGAHFEQVDMRHLNLAKTFDVILAWHSFFHLPEKDQPAMFPVFRRHLNPGGILVFTSGNKRGEAWGINGGENLFHASLDKMRYEELLIGNNFNILSYTEDDPECGFATVWMAQLASPTGA